MTKSFYSDYSLSLFSRSIYPVAQLFLFFILTSMALQVRATSDPGKITGTVYDLESKHPIEYATIILYHTANDSMVTGTISKPDGYFELDQLPYDNYYLLISFIGYSQQRIDAIVLTEEQSNAAVGEILLSPDAQILSEIEIVADHHTIDYQIDKKVISVNQMLSSASMSAVEILENVPSIRVDIEGNVSLRGSSGITVLIDGKPTILDASDILSQIPASSIQSIEIITNPSAKYEPDGTGGIINVITRKNRSLGLQGILNASTNSFGMYESDILLNYNTRSFNIFVSGQYGMSPRIGQSNDERRTTVNDTTTQVTSTGEYERNRFRYEGKFGFDWLITPKINLTLEARLGRFDRNSSSDLHYLTTRDMDGFSLEEVNLSESARGGDYQNYSLNYMHRFGPDHQLSFQGNYRYRTGKEFSQNVLQDLEGTVRDGSKTTEDGPSHRFDAKLDYTLPLRENRFLESGLQLRTNLSQDITNYFLYDLTSQDFVLQEDFANETEYNSDIFALYGMFREDRSTFGYQLGLRTEYTFREITSSNAENLFVIDRWDWFPTVHVSYKMPGEQQLMLSYARRIDRPRGYYLEPFITWSDQFNLRRGNPDIQPEYIDGYELGYMKEWENARFSIEAYHRIQYNKIESFQEVYQTGVLLTTFENVGTDYSTGLETMLNIPLFTWWDFTLMGNVYDYRIQGDRQDVSFAYQSFNWSSRVDNSFRVAQRLRFQLNGQYNSPTVTSQGKQLAYYELNAAVRADFFQDKLSAVFQVRDIFGTHRHVSISEDVDFYNYRSRTTNGPIFSISLSYKINNFRQAEERRNGERPGNSDGEMNGDFEG